MGVDEALMGYPTASQAEYELREARSEIARHHKLIAEMKSDMEWLIYMTGELANHWFLLGEEDWERLNSARKLLNRQVS